MISQVWSRATPGGAKIAGGYLTIENKGSAPDLLIGGSGDFAGKVEVHEMAMNNGVMTMRALDKGLAIEPGKTVKLAPGGYHLMLMDLKSPLKQGDKVPLTLEFEKAGKVKLARRASAWACRRRRAAVRPAMTGRRCPIIPDAAVRLKMLRPYMPPRQFSRLRRLACRVAGKCARLRWKIVRPPLAAITRRYSPCRMAARDRPRSRFGCRFRKA